MHLFTYVLLSGRHSFGKTEAVLRLSLSAQLNKALYTGTSTL